jgi:hypothetical protein
LLAVVGIEAQAAAQAYQQQLRERLLVSHAQEPPCTPTVALKMKLENAPEVE